MSHITYTDGVTVVPAAWLNDVDKVIYTLFGNGTSLSNPVTLPSGNVSFLQSSAGAVARTVQSKERDIVSIKDFGATGDGVTDDTAAITAAWNFVQAQTFAGIAPTNVPIITGALFFPAGDYVFNGPALNYSTNSAIYFLGAGRQQTRIKVAAGIYFVNTDKTIYSCNVSGIHFTGGKGAFRFSNAGVNVQGTMVFEDNYFGNYTECAIGNNSSDMPYWKIRRNIFYGTTASIGVALAGLEDASTISDNSFQLNRFGIKLSGQGDVVQIHDNDFLRFSTGAGQALCDIWITPGGQTTGGVGTRIVRNRFGNENLSAIDYRVLIADEDTGTGTDHLNYQPKFSASTGFVSGLKVKDNMVAGITSARALIVSWAKQLSGLEVKNEHIGTIIQTLTYGAGVNVPSGTQDALINTFEVIPNAPTTALLPEPVVPYAGVLDDPNCLYAGYGSVFSKWGSGLDPSYLDLRNINFAAFTIGSGSVAGTTDALGGTDAVEFTATASGFLAFGVQVASTANRVGFIEFDLRQGSSLPLPTLDFRLTNNANSDDLAVRRIINIPSYWQRVRIPFSLPSLNSTYNLIAMQIQGFSAGVATKFRIGRLRIYHAHEPQNPALAFGTLNTNAPVTETNAARTVLVTDSDIICNRAGTVTLTILSAALYQGKEIRVRTIQAQTVVSAASDVVPLVGGAAGTAILAATAGKWAVLKSDGTSWQIMSGN